MPDEMASSREEEKDEETLLHEFEVWQETNASDAIFLLESSRNEDGALTISMLLGSEHEFKVLCPSGYPRHMDCFYVEASPAVALWCSALNEYLLGMTESCSFTQLLNKGASLHHSRVPTRSSDDDIEIDLSGEEEEEDDTEMMAISDDDSAFTTEWELRVARRKKLWAQKEVEVREQMEKARGGVTNATELGAIQASGQEKEQAKQIFTSFAASGILTNDLVRIMESEEEFGFSADPIDNNIYQWCVKLFRFDEKSELHKDLVQINEIFGYGYIELELDFTIDLYPFYPPLVKVIRPRLQGSMMQRVTNMEILKLSYWNPAKDMKNVLHDIKTFLQQWARLEVPSERNDAKRYPSGSYVEIEHHLLRLSLVSEVSPRVNLQYHLDYSDIHQQSSVSRPAMDESGKKNVEYWAPGTGYGHEKRAGWDVKAYLAAQKEKDKQIEAVLHKILQELKILYVNHAPQLKPRNSAATASDVPSEMVDPIEDMYSILEGSSLIPFIEQNMRADSFLEICRHTAVYKMIVDIIKEIALQPQLVRLLCMLPGQPDSVYNLVQTMDQKASTLINHMCRSGNGTIPKPAKKKTKKEKAPLLPIPGCSSHESSGATASLTMAVEQAAEEEKLAREFITLHKDISELFKRNNIHNETYYSPQKSNTDQVPALIDKEKALEAKYREVLQGLQFDCHDIELEGPSAHHYSSSFKTMQNPSQSQVFRIAQEYTSLSSSLPINLSSSIFVRTDDDKLPLMRALVTGPEGTPYSCGCFLFDIFFGDGYPKMPPKVNLQTTGGGSVRFNPNLYNCGKVCLSLLGTWEGKQGETWNDTTSTILQVLVSIQSLILVPEPYFNEPGYEQEIGSDGGKRHSADYNLDVIINNIKYAIIAQITNPSPGFEDIIHAHFYLKRDRLIEEAEKWVRSNKSSKLERTVQNMKTELRKLKPPSNLSNFFADSESTA